MVYTRGRVLNRLQSSYINEILINAADRTLHYTDWIELFLDYVIGYITISVLVAANLTLSFEFY